MIGRPSALSCKRFAFRVGALALIRADVGHALTDVVLEPEVHRRRPRIPVLRRTVVTAFASATTSATFCLAKDNRSATSPGRSGSIRTSIGTCINEHDVRDDHVGDVFPDLQEEVELLPPLGGLPHVAAVDHAGIEALALEPGHRTGSAADIGSLTRSTPIASIFVDARIGSASARSP